MVRHVRCTLETSSLAGLSIPYPYIVQTSPRFLENPLAPVIPGAYKKAVSSKSSGKRMDDSTGLRSKTKLNTPLSRCESRPNGPAESVPLYTRPSKRKKRGPDIAGALFLSEVDTGFEEFQVKGLGAL
jgi:hypothetical protein